MSRKLLVAALLATTAALMATPTFAAAWHPHGSVRRQSSWQAENTSDPTQFMVENSIPVQDHHTPGISDSAAPMPTGAYAYAPAATYRQHPALVNDPTMYAIRNSIPETYPHVPGIGSGQ